MSRLITPTEDRFEAKVIFKANACWMWAGSSNCSGYGSILHRGIQTRAHRVAYELYKGPIHEGMQILHMCDTPQCVNPAHLVEGTYFDNAADRSSKNRSHRSYKSRDTKLTEAEVIEIIGLVECGFLYKEIAPKFNVSVTTIRRVFIGEYK